MSSQSSVLNKVLVLPAIVFVVLVIFTVRMSNKMIFKSDNPVYKEYIVWKYEGEDYPLLLHSVKIQDTILNAYSRLAEKQVTYPIQKADRDYFDNIMNSYSYQYRECSNCHRLK